MWVTYKLKWDLQGYNFKKNKNLPQYRKKKKRFRGCQCHGDMIKENPLDIFWCLQCQNSEVTSGGCLSNTSLCGELKKVRVSNQPGCWQVIAWGALGSYHHLLHSHLSATAVCGFNHRSSRDNPPATKVCEVITKSGRNVSGISLTENTAGLQRA